MNVVKVKTLVTSKIQMATARSDSSVTVLQFGGYAEETTGLCATTHRHRIFVIVICDGY